MSRPLSAHRLFILRFVLMIVGLATSLVLLLAQTGGNAQLEHPVTFEKYPMQDAQVRASKDPYVARAVQELQGKVSPLEAEAFKNDIINSVVKKPSLLAIPFALAILNQILQFIERHIEDRAKKVPPRTPADNPRRSRFFSRGVARLPRRNGRYCRFGRFTARSDKRPPLRGSYR